MRRSRWQMRRLRGKKERGIHHRVRRVHGGRAEKKKTTQSTLSYAENFSRKTERLALTDRESAANGVIVW
jgi:hypothetical protein